MIRLEIEYDNKVALEKLSRGQVVFADILRSDIQKVGRRAVRKAKDLSPVGETGDFRDAWRYRTQVIADGYELSLQNTDPKAEWIIKGTDPHFIFPRDAKALRWFTESGEAVFAKAVEHPGTEPNDIFEKLENDPELEAEVQTLFDARIRAFALRL